MSTRERSMERILAVRNKINKEDTRRARRLTDMLLRYDKVVLRSRRTSIFKHDIVAILEVHNMSIAMPRTWRVDVEGRVHPPPIFGSVPRKRH